MSLLITALPHDIETQAAEPPYVDDEGGAPLRCCLRDSRAGERVRLVQVAPPGPRGPYAETGPVFLHAEAGSCPGPPAGYPEEWRARDQVFRAYSADGRIVGGRVVRATDDQEAVAAGLLDDPDVAFVHSRNVVFGCFMFAMSHRLDVNPAPAGRGGG